MSLKRLLLIVFMLLVGAVIAATWLSYHQVQRVLTSNNPPAADYILLEIKPGTHSAQLLSELKQKGYHVDLPMDYWLSRVWLDGRNLQAGVYRFEPNEFSLPLVFQKARDGEQYQFSVTLVEGFTLQQWRDQLASQLYLKHDTAHLSDDELYSMIASDEPWPSLEGALYPDTYRFYAYTSELSILRTAFNKMQSEVKEIWRGRQGGLPYNSAYELLVMASIIEKETGLDGERDMVSSVFYNRLKIGMRLQSDPTTIYGVKNFDGNLTRAHLRELTPYNTYRIDGLPPTPIAMPSRASLVAAAHPAESNYYYFVADGHGQHIFSQTLQEHNRAVNRYQRQQTH